MVFRGSWIAKPSATATSRIGRSAHRSVVGDRPYKASALEEETGGAFSLANDSKWPPPRRHPICRAGGLYRRGGQRYPRPGA